MEEVKEHEGLMLEYSGAEGADFKDFFLTGISHPSNVGLIETNKDKANLPLKFYMKLVGLKDDNAPKRNWGVQDIREGLQASDEDPAVKIKKFVEE